MIIDYILAASGIGIFLFTGALIYLGVRGVRDQLRVQMFAEYTRRYGAIVDRLPSRWRRPGEVIAFGDLSHEGQEEMAAAARAYFNLCSEELHLRKEGHIDEVTWRIWTRGMRDMFRLRWLQEMWAELAGEYTYYPDFCHFVESELVDARGREGDVAGSGSRQ